MHCEKKAAGAALGLLLAAFLALAALVDPRVTDDEIQSEISAINLAGGIRARIDAATTAGAAQELRAEIEANKMVLGFALFTCRWANTGSHWAAAGAGASNPGRMVIISVWNMTGFADGSCGGGLACDGCSGLLGRLEGG